VKTHFQNPILMPALVAGMCLMPTGRLTAQTFTAVTHIAGGGCHSLFTKSDGTLWGMGDNFFGQLGLGPTLQFIETPVPIASGVGMVAAGEVHSLFSTDNGIWAMGANEYGQLGDGTTNNHYFPERVFVAGPTVRLTALAAGGEHSLFGSYTVLRGSLWTMGFNEFGELGDGTTTDHDTPEVVASASPGSPVTASAGGFSYSLFIRPDGSLWGMGNNLFGQLGDGTFTDRHAPEQIVSTGVVALAAGASHSLFVKSDGSLWAMGNRDFGQLGDGSISVPFPSTPELIVTNGVTAVAAGANHTLFIRSDGSLWAMGYNAFGQLGLGTTNDSSLPVLIVASNVVSVAAGDNHSLFIMSDGSLWGMGNNSCGQLGDGTSTDHLVPVPIVFPPIILANPAKLPAGAFQFSFTNTPGVGFTALASTNLSLPLTNWTVLGAVVENQPGQFQFTDTAAAANKLRFYRVRSP
jgi:alpha-tubulin suppressor-like RCC1 family protein